MPVGHKTPTPEPAPQENHPFGADQGLHAGVQGAHRDAAPGAESRKLSHIPLIVPLEGGKEASRLLEAIGSQALEETAFVGALPDDNRVRGHVATAAVEKPVIPSRCPGIQGLLFREEHMPPRRARSLARAVPVEPPRTMSPRVLRIFCMVTRESSVPVAWGQRGPVGYTETSYTTLHRVSTSTPPQKSICRRCASSFVLVFLLTDPGPMP